MAVAPGLRFEGGVKAPFTGVRGNVLFICRRPAHLASEAIKEMNNWGIVYSHCK